LKRNGETCRFVVPNFSGRLSASEHQAYTVAFVAVDEQLRHHNDAACALASLSTELQNAGKEANGLIGDPIGAVEVSGSGDGSWQIRRSLLKTSRNELLLCSRQTGTGEDFGIVEKFDPDSAYARAQGNAELIMTGNNVVLLLQDYVENESKILEAFKRDLEASVEEILAEKYPGENFSRVVKAISAQCGYSHPGNAQNIRPAKPARGVKIRF
jgi:hypothetical protein